MENDGVKRILHMIGSLNVGGSQTLIMNIYRKIDRNKLQFDFVVDHPEHLYFAEEIRQLGGKIYTMPTFRGWNIVEVVEAWNEFFGKHREYEVLHSHVRSYASIYFIVAKKYNVKTIIHSHSLSNGNGAQALVKKILQYPLRFQADYFMACSQDAGEWLFGKNIVRNNNFYFVKNAINAEKYRFSNSRRIAKRKEIGMDNHTFLLGYVGRVTAVKNPLFAIKVFQELVEMNASAHKYKDIRMLFVGDGDLLSDMKKSVIEFGVADKVIFTGTKTDVADLFMIMDYYIFPSLWEGLGISLIEAQASGLQCICSENIPREAIVTDLVDSYILSAGSAAWAERIFHAVKYERNDRVDEIKASGFDIQETAKFMQEFYLSC